MQVDVTEGKGIEIASSITGLHVLKSTGSQFWGFIRDEYTTLPEVWDRILCTQVAATWKWKKYMDVKEVEADKAKFDNAWSSARDIILKQFAEDNSASVQATMYKMAQQILAAVPQAQTVDFTLPNKHYFEVGRFHSGTQETQSLTPSLQILSGTRESRTLARTQMSTCRNLLPTGSSNVP